MDRLKVVIGYTVTAVWTILFISAIIKPPHSDVLLFVQATMAIVAGSVFNVKKIFKRKEKP